MKTRRIAFSLALLLTLQLALQMVRPANAATLPRAKVNSLHYINPAVSILQQKSTAQQAEIEEAAKRMGPAFEFGEDGVVRLKKSELKGLSDEEIAAVKSLVRDCAKKRLGIAIIKDDGSFQLFGSEKALNPNTSRGGVEPQWVDWNGVHIWLGEWWMNQLWNLNGALIGALIGMISTALCATSVLCAASFIVGGVVFSMVWNLIPNYNPKGVTITFPWWGRVYYDIYNPGSWNHGRRVYSPFWT